MQEITIQRTTTPKQKPVDETKLGFGSVFTDHMFLMNYKTGEGWINPRIVPYGPIDLDPAAMCLHYGQEIFEGMKAYRADDGRIMLFRPEENFKRMNASNERLCIPQVDVDFCVHAVNELVKLEKDWVPHIKDTSLYIRPFVFATDPHLGVRAGDEYTFAIILAPSGPYYAEGLKPVKIYVEHKWARAVKGGTGMAKAAGNYATSLIAQVEAHDQGYSQVLWLDGAQKKYIEEVGAMNIFFKIGDEIVTPMLSGSILPGITRKSVLELLRSLGYNATERLIPMQELVDAYNAGELKEVFGTGTAAVISPVGTLKYDDLVMTINNGEIGPVSQMLYDKLTGIQWGREPDTFGWTREVK